MFWPLKKSRWIDCDLHQTEYVRIIFEPQFVTMVYAFKPFKLQVLIEKYAMRAETEVRDFLRFGFPSLFYLLLPFQCFVQIFSEASDTLETEEFYC